MTFADPHKEHYLGVELSFGGTDLPVPAGDGGLFDDDPTYVRLTNYTTDVTLDGETFSSAPEMEVRFGKNSGSLGDGKTHVDVKRAYIPDELTSGLHAPVDVRVLEFVGGDTGDETRVRFRGVILRTLRNVEGQSGIDRLVCSTMKRLLDRSANPPADHLCVWKLFGKGCVTFDQNPDIGALTGQGPGSGLAAEMSGCDLASIDGTTATIEDLVDKGTGRGNIWQAGYLEYRGLRIWIRDWDKDDTTPGDPGRVDTTFKLSRQPPASWIGQRVRAVPGCPKTIEECIQRWDNELNFGGLGHAILPYNPLIDDAPC